MQDIDVSRSLAATHGTNYPSTQDTPNATAAHHPKVPTGPAQKDEAPVGAVLQTRARRGVADTSAEAFHSLPVADYLAPKERAVMALFTGPEVRLSRQQIADMVPMRLCGCCGRVDSLITKGALVECGDRIDPETGKRQKTLQLPQPAQRELGEGVA